MSDIFLLTVVFICTIFLIAKAVLYVIFLEKPKLRYSIESGMLLVGSLALYMVAKFTTNL